MPSLALACRLSAAQAPQPLPRRVRNILSKYQATALIPGASSVAVQTFSPGNFVESTGQTVTPVDGAVGLAVDAAGTAIDMATPSTDSTRGWGSYMSTLSSDGTSLTITNTSSSGEGYAYFQQGNIIAGKTYRVEFEVVARSATSGFLQIGQTLVTVSGLGVKTVTAKATNTHGIWIGAGGAIAGNSVTIRNVRLWELPGIHATQSTTQNKPVLRRGLVNLLTYSNFQQGITDASIRGGTVSLSSIDGYGNAIAFGYDGSTLSYAYKGTFSAVNGTVYTMAAVVKMDDGNAPVFGSGVPSNSANPFSFVIGGATPEPTGFSITSLGNSLYMVVGVSGGTVSVPTSNGVIKYGSNNNRTFKVTSYALFQGTVTAEQIIAAGGIPVTTTAPASSAVGPQYWRFDPIDDALQMTLPAGAGWDSTTIITGRATGQVTQTAQNVQGAHSITGGGDMYCRFYVPNGGNLSASELQVLQRFANRVAGVA